MVMTSKMHCLESTGGLGFLGGRIWSEDHFIGDEEEGSTLAGLLLRESREHMHNIRLSYEIRV